MRKMKRNDLLYEAVKLFGGWRPAIEASGFRPIQKGWTKKEIINEIKKVVKEIGRIPTGKELTKIGSPGLNSVARRRFRGWRNALKAAGFKPLKRKWNKDKTIKEIKQIYKQIGHSPSMRKLKRINKYDLLNAGLKYFGTYNNFLGEAGLPIVLEMNKWPRSKIIKELQKIHRLLGRTPRRTELVRMKRHDLINATQRHLSCWSNALIASGLTPNSDVLDDDITWREWEDLIFKIISRKNINYEKKKYIKKVGYPDIYIPSENKIIEIKLNCSENSVKKDIEKYLPYCKKLEIWYLFGKHFGILSNKVRFVGPNKIRSMLKTDNLIAEFNKIKKKVEGKKIEM